MFWLGDDVNAPAKGLARLPDLGRRYVRGWFRQGDARLCVTTGLGTSGPSVRLGAAP